MNNFLKKILIIIFLLFWLPILFNRAPLLREDAAFVSFPRIMACARQVSNGIIPLLDDLTFCGARPFYASLDTPVYYLPLYPFLWLAGNGSADTVWYYAYVLPLALHILVAFAGVMYLCRRLFGITFLSRHSLLCGFIYAFSPVMIYAFKSLTTLFALAWFPWAMACIIRPYNRDNQLDSSSRHNNWNINTSAINTWAIFFTGLILLSGDINIALRIVTFLFVTALIQNYRDLKRLALILAGALLIGLPALIGQGRGLSWLSAIDGTIETSGVMKTGIMDIVAWICPAFFGVETGTSYLFSSTFYPVAQKIFLPGFFIFLLFFTGIFFCFRFSSPQNSDPDQISVKAPGFLALSTGLFIFASIIPSLIPAGLLSLLPDFLITVLFAPQPIYWLYPAVLGVAALSCYALIRLDRDSSVNSKTRIFIIIICFVLTGFVLLAGTRAVPYIGISRQAAMTRPLNELQKIDTNFTYRDWIVSGPGSIPVISGGLMFIFLLATFFNARRLFASNYRQGLYRLLAVGLFLLITVEYTLWVYFYLYKPIFYPVVPAKGGYGKLFHCAASKPSRHDFYSQTRIIDSGFKSITARFSGTLSDIDNLAWVTNVPAVAGYDCKPLYPLFRKLLIASGLQPFYKMNTSILSRIFLRNLGVKKRYNYSVSPNISKSVVGLKKYYSNSNVRSLNLVSRSIEKVLPLISIQTNIQIADIDSCVLETIDGNLMEKVVIEKAEYDKALFNAEELVPFDKEVVQGKKKAIKKSIKIIEYSPDKTILEVNLSDNGFIVINKCWDSGWKAVVNKKLFSPVRINTFMQGIYLKKGSYKIELFFQPYHIYVGYVISILMLILTLVPGIMKSGFFKTQTNQG